MKARIIHLTIILLFIYSISNAEITRYIPPTFFSMQSHSLQGDTAFHARTCELMADAGVRIIRDEMYWSNLEKVPGKIVFPENYIQNVDITLAYGMEPMIILDYANPNYDNGKPPYTDEGRVAFARYCSAVVSQFKGKIKYFEIWNEPNIAGFWNPEPNPKDYALLLKSAYQACKSANPNCVILGGVTSLVDTTFIEKVFQNGGAQYMDIISVHPYTGVSPEENDLIGKLNVTRKLSEKYEKPLRIWITEVGYPTHIGPNGFPEATQAKYLVRTYLQALASGWVDAVFWYWFGPDGPDATYSEDRFGIIRQDWSEKPAYAAYRTMTEQLRKARLLGSISNETQSILGYRYQVGSNQVTVLWSKQGLATASLKTKANQITRVLSDGTQQVFIPWQNVVTLTFTEAPTYIISGKEPVQLSSPLIQFANNKYVFPPGSVKEANLFIDNRIIKPARKLDGEVKVSVLPAEMQTNQNIIRFEAKPMTTSICKIDITTPQLALNTTAILSADLMVGNKRAGLVSSEVMLTEPAVLLIHPILDGKTSTKKIDVVLKNLMESPVSGEILVSSIKDVIFSQSDILFGNLSANREQVFESELRGSGFQPDTLYPIEVKAYLSNGKILAKQRVVDFLPCKKATQPIVIDGKLDEWNDAAQITLNRADQITSKKANWRGIYDCSGAVYTLWDDQNLYVSAIILDDIKSNSIKPGSNIYRSDGLEVYLDTDLYGDEDMAKYSDDDYQFGFFNTPEGSIVWRWSPGDQLDNQAKLAIVYRDDIKDDTGQPISGYVIEGSIPLSELKLQPKPGTVIGFTVAIDDDDTPDSIDPFNQDKQMNWAGNKNNWCDPTGFGQLFFTE
ncbi:MAG: sugar-binding protein [bacterium]